MRDKTTAGILALLAGGLGVHKFYLGKPGMGIVYFLFCWTLIPGFVAFIEGIQYLTMNDQLFNERYNQEFLAHQANRQLPPQPGYTQPQHQQNYYAGQPQPNYAAGTQPARQTTPPTDNEIYERLEKLNDLRVSGVLSEEEFAAEKQRLLNR